MDRWIWKVQNSVNFEEAVKAPLKDQWIFFYNPKNLIVERKAAEKEEESREE